MRRSVRKIMVAAAAGAVGAVSVVPLGKAAAAGVAGPYYVGASVGQSSFQTGGFDPYLGSFGTSNVSFLAQPLGWKILVGARPFSFLGAEIEYVDFGEAHSGKSGEVVALAGDARGGAAFAVGYLPIPLPNLDVFGKLGVARYRAAYHFSGDLSNTNDRDPVLGKDQPGAGQINASGASDVTGLAYGVGAEYRLGAFAVRAEFEKIGTTESETAPSLLSVGLTYRF